MSIKAGLQLNCSQFLAAIAQADRSVPRVRNSIIFWSNSLQGIGHIAGGVSNILLKMSGAMDLGGNLSDLAAATGAPAEGMAVLRQTLENAGVGADVAGSMGARLQKAIAGVNEDGQSTGDVFPQLGVNILALPGMEANTRFETLPRNTKGFRAGRPHRQARIWSIYHFTRPMALASRSEMDPENPLNWMRYRFPSLAMPPCDPSLPAITVYPPIGKRL